MGGRTMRHQAAAFLQDVVLPYAGDDCLIWPFFRAANGYGRIQVDRRPALVHRIVCKHANGSPPTPAAHASHSCGRGKDGCVNPRHLSWKTPAANMADKRSHGTDPRGSRNSQSALREEDIPVIRSLAGEKTQKEIAEMFGVSKSTIGMVQTGATWGHVR